MWVSRRRRKACAPDCGKFNFLRIGWSERLRMFDCDSGLPFREQNSSPDLRSPMNSINSFATFSGRSISRSPLIVLRKSVIAAARAKADLLSKATNMTVGDFLKIQGMVTSGAAGSAAVAEQKNKFQKSQAETQNAQNVAVESGVKAANAAKDEALSQTGKQLENTGKSHEKLRNDSATAAAYTLGEYKGFLPWTKPASADAFGN